MAISCRATVTTALSLVGLACLVGPSLGQQPDHDVRKTAASTPAPKATPATIGTIDLDAVFRGYDRVKDSSDAFKAEVMQRQKELVKIQEDGKQATEMLAKLQPNTPDFKKMEKSVGEIKARLQVAQEQGQIDLSQKEADSLAMLYKDIQQMVAAVAKQHGFTYVVRVSNEPVTGSEPQSVMAAMARPIVYADPSAKSDISKEVVHHLNYYYHQSNPNAPSGAAAPAAGSNARPAPPATSAPAPPNGGR